MKRDGTLSATLLHRSEAVIGGYFRCGRPLILGFSMKYRCRVARLRIDVTEIDLDLPDVDTPRGVIEAGNAAASALAETIALNLPDSRWVDATDFYFDEYRPWTIRAMSEAAAKTDGDVTLDEAFDDEALEYTKFLLLEADTFGGDGRVIMQPWFNADRPGLLESDIIGDWLHELGFIRERYGDV